LFIEGLGLGLTPTPTPKYYDNNKFFNDNDKFNYILKINKI